MLCFVVLDFSLSTRCILVHFKILFYCKMYHSKDLCSVVNSVMFVHSLAFFGGLECIENFNHTIILAVLNVL